MRDQAKGRVDCQVRHIGHFQVLTVGAPFLKEAQEGGPEKRTRKEAQKRGLEKKNKKRPWKEAQKGDPEKRSRKDTKQIGLGKRPRKESQ